MAPTLVMTTLGAWLALVPVAMTQPAPADDTLVMAITGDSIITRVVSGERLSEPFGTTIELEDGIGVVTLPSPAGAQR